MADNIFEGDTPPATPPVAPVTPPSVVPPEIAELVGEGKKYKSVEDALKSVPHAQKHIQALEEENARVKEELEKRRTAEELLDEIRNGITPTTPGQQAPVGIDPEQLETTLNVLLSRKEAAKTASANINLVVEKFTALYGDKTKGEEAFYNLAAESGLDPNALNQLAATSPNAIFKLAGFDLKKDPPVGKPNSTVNTQSLNQGKPEGQSAKVKMVGASTKEVTQAWKNARETALQQLGLK